MGRRRDRLSEERGNGRKRRGKQKRGGDPFPLSLPFPTGAVCPRTPLNLECPGFVNNPRGGEGANGYLYDRFDLVQGWI